jgi:uncharacterized cupin superfamily protein
MPLQWKRDRAPARGRAGTISKTPRLPAVNRLKACEIAGVQPWFESKDGNPWELAWACNGARRDLAEAQKACALRACEEGAARWRATQGEVAERANEARATAKTEAVQQQERDEQGRFGPWGATPGGETRGG